MYAVLEETARAHAGAPALHQPLGKGKYRTYNWTEYRDAVREVACGLDRLGIRKGDFVALHSETRAEFYLADMGIMSRGAVAAALYTSYPVPELIKNLRNSRPRAIFCENAKGMKALVDAGGEPALAEHWILLTGDAPNALTLDQLRELGRQALAEDPHVFDRIRSEFDSGDDAILYLTSGATGEPKMGLVTHDALVSNIDQGPAVLPLQPHDTTIAFLPSAHIAQRVVSEVLPIRQAVAVYFSESLARLPNELKTIKPSFLLAPPRVWERIFASINTEIRKKNALTRKLFHGALGLGSEAARLREEGKPIPRWMQTSLKLADKLVFSKIKERLGGHIRIAASGAAPLGKELAGFFAAIGMPLIEGYGLTEGGVLCLNPIDRPRSGSIGKPLPLVQVKLAEDGELLCKSPTLFRGYFNDPKATEAVLKDGWLYTGDIAEIDSEGYVYITGRKKELIVSSNGKKIYPSRIEGFFKTEPLINQMVLIGDRLPYVTALFTVNTANAEQLKGMESMKGRDVREIALAPQVSAQIQDTVTRVNKQLAPFEQIRKFRIIEREFTIESGEVTPTMKVRRNRVLENHRDLISELYVGKEESQ
jgi:long-chain acyl-CoA synthetase